MCFCGVWPPYISLRLHLYMSKYRVTIAEFFTILSWLKNIFTYKRVSIFKRHMVPATFTETKVNCWDEFELNAVFYVVFYVFKDYTEKMEYCRHVTWFMIVSENFILILKSKLPFIPVTCCLIFLRTIEPFILHPAKELFILLYSLSVESQESASLLPGCVLTRFSKM